MELQYSIISLIITLTEKNIIILSSLKKSNSETSLFIFNESNIFTQFLFWKDMDYGLCSITNSIIVHYTKYWL